MPRRNDVPKDKICKAKDCIECLQHFDASHFYFNFWGVVSSRCKSCTIKRNKEYSKKRRNKLQDHKV